MDLLEYQARELFAAHEVPVPAGAVADNADEARLHAGDLDIEATAYLAGGAVRARQTAELRLMRDGFLGVDVKHKKLFSDGEVPRDATPLGRSDRKNRLSLSSPVA